MSVEDLIITVFCKIDDLMNDLGKNWPRRERGFAPKLADSEVVTMEVVGELMGIDSEKGTWLYFRKHWLNLFPCMPSRTSFVRQVANLWSFKAKLQHCLAGLLGGLADSVHLIDGFPVPVCRIARAPKSGLFRGSAGYGYCAAKREKFYGFKGHLVISSSGCITSIALAPAGADERVVSHEITEGLEGLLIGDKGYISPTLSTELAKRNLFLQTPLRSNMKDKRPKGWVKRLLKARRLIETVISQLSERFHIEKVKARDLWHLTSRIWRKCLAHTIGVWLNREAGRPDLHLAEIGS